MWTKTSVSGKAALKNKGEMTIRTKQMNEKDTTRICS